VALPFICQIVADALGTSGMFGVVRWTLTVLFRWWNLWRNTWLHCDVSLICWNGRPCRNQRHRITNYKAVAAWQKKTQFPLTRFEGSTMETSLSPRESFRMQIFLSTNIIESAASPWWSYTCMNFSWNVGLHNILDLSSMSLRASAQNLINKLIQKILNRRCTMSLISSYHMPGALVRPCSNM